MPKPASENRKTVNLSRQKIFFPAPLRQIIGIVLAILFLINSGCSNETPIRSQEILPLEQRLPYKDYIFSAEEKVIDFGDQPFWVPASIIFEVMLRDPILREELKKMSFTLRTHHFLKGNDVNHFLAKGDLEIGFAGDMPTLAIASTGKADVISILPVGAVSIVSRDIREVADLKGKKIAYAYGSNAHFYLLNTLRKNRVDVSDVRLVDMDITKMANALKSKAIDAYSTWEFAPPTTTGVIQEKTTTHQGIAYGFFCVRQDFFRKNTDVVYQLLAAQIRALSWLRENDDHVKLVCFWLYTELNEWGQKESPLSLEKLIEHVKQAMMGVYHVKYPRIPPDLFGEGNLMNLEFIFMKENELIPENAVLNSVKDGFIFDAIEEVIAKPVKYRLDEKMLFMGEKLNDV